jgi:hypothetical protein
MAIIKFREKEAANTAIAELPHDGDFKERVMETGEET